MTKNVNVKVKIICEDLVEMPDPEASVDTGTYAVAQSVILSSSIDDAIIMYTTDTTIPSKINGTEYSSPITISATTTLKLYAYKPGYEDSSIITKVYTITV
jgi:endoglucanase